MLRQTVGILVPPVPTIILESTVLMVVMEPTTGRGRSWLPKIDNDKSEHTVTTTRNTARTDTMFVVRCVDDLSCLDDVGEANEQYRLWCWCCGMEVSSHQDLNVENATVGPSLFQSVACVVCLDNFSAGSPMMFSVGKLSNTVINYMVSQVKVSDIWNSDHGDSSKWRTQGWSSAVVVVVDLLCARGGRCAVKGWDWLCKLTLLVSLLN